MSRLAAAAILATCFGCSSQKSDDPLVGTYVVWMFLEGQAVAYNGSQGMSEKLTLQPNGTYTFQMETSVMVSISAKAKGKYSRSGDDVVFAGSMATTTDDGYKKGTETGPHHLKLKLENGMLMGKDGKNDPYYYRKEGTGPPPLPTQLQLKPSDDAAVALIEKVEKTYASLRSLKVTGTVQSQGGGFVAKNANFRLLFQSPSQFRFEASVLLGSNGETDENQITWDGGAKCWWYAKEFGEITDRTLGNALSIVAVNAGPQANLLSELLLPKELGQGALSAEPEATLLPDEKLGGKVCAVLQLRSQGASATKVWVDKSSGMILQLYEELRGITVTFASHPNVAIAPQDFMLGKRAKVGRD